MTFEIKNYMVIQAGNYTIVKTDDYEKLVNGVDSERKALYIGGVINSTCTGENSVIFAYGKGYTSFKELEQDHNEIQKNPIAFLSILKKNSF